MPFPDPDWPVDVLDVYLAAVAEANVDPVADAFIDDRGDADPARFCQRLKASGDVDAVAVDIVAFDDDVAEIDSDPEDDFRLVQGFVRQCSVGALHRQGAIYRVDHAAELTIVPSPISFTMRPLWAATAGSKIA